MGQMLTLTTADGKQIGAYRADPTGTPRGAIVVLQEIFGVNHHIRAVTDSYAAEGYVAIAPALFDRAEPGVEMGYDKPDADRGVALRAAVGIEDTVRDIQAAVDAVKSVGKVGIVGYCWGGSLVFLAASRVTGLAAGSGYYGGLIAGPFLENEPKIPVILHFGDADTGIPLTDVEKVKQRYPALPIHVYPAGHGFNCNERASYHAESARIARERTLALFAQHVG